jgi:hypothetical protein
MCHLTPSRVNFRGVDVSSSLARRACYDGSGINASDTLKNDNFKPHPALKSLLEWLSKRGSSQPMRNAASRALSIYNGWAESNGDVIRQLSLFQEP